MREIFFCWISEKLSRNEISRAAYDRYCIDFDMTAKCFSNFRTLVYGIFKYAKRKKYVSFSITYTIQDFWKLSKSIIGAFWEFFFGASLYFSLDTIPFLS